MSYRLDEQGNVLYLRFLKLKESVDLYEGTVDSISYEYLDEVGNLFTVSEDSKPLEVFEDIQTLLKSKISYLDASIKKLDEEMDNKTSLVHLLRDKLELIEMEENEKDYKLYMKLKSKFEGKL